MNEGCGGQREAYQMLLDNIPGGVQQHLNDEAYTLVEVNQGFLELFGYTKQELQEQFENQYMQMIHPEDRQSVVKQVAEQLLLKKRVALEYRVFCRDGSYKWVLDNSQIISCAGEKERFFCVLVDITENRNCVFPWNAIRLLWIRPRTSFLNGISGRIPWSSPPTGKSGLDMSPYARR